MRKSYFILAGYLVITLLLGGLQYYTGWPVPSNEAEVLRGEVATLSAQIADQRNTITAYQWALIGEQSDVLSMYQSVQAAAQVEIVVHADTESGLPVKFILDCGTIQPEESK